MRRINRALRDLGEDQRGATIVEFSLVCIPFITMLCAMFELGFRQYVAVQLQDALDQAARKVMVAEGTTSSQLKASIEPRIKVVSPGATVTVKPTSYDKFQNVAKAEPITTDTAPLGVYNPGDCFTDINGNGNWDSDAGTVDSTGGSDDVVLYTATVQYREVVPVSGLLGWSSTRELTATTMLKNQPYASQPEPDTVCK